MFKNVLLYSLFIILIVTTVNGEVDTGGHTAQSTKEKEYDKEEILEEDTDLSISLTDVPPVQEGEIILKEKCEKNGGNSSYETLLQAKNEVKECFKPLINFTELPIKVQEASPRGDVDLVFMEYCRQSSQIKSCMDNFLFKVEPCLAENEKFSKYTVQNITESLFSFICDSQGNNIAVFYTEDGLQCIMAKKLEIERCLNITLGYDVNNSSIPERNGLFSFEFDLKECRTVTKLRTCIINELMACPRTTAANVVDSVFNLILTSTPCSKFPESLLSDKVNKAYSLHLAAASIILPFITVILTRIYN